MKLNEKFEATIWGVLGVVGGTTIVVAGAVWTLSRALQSDELEGYRTAAGWKVSDAIKDLSDLSKQAALDSRERAELIKLRSDIAASQADASRQAERLTALEASNVELRSALNSIVKESVSIEVPTGEARFAVPNTLAIGVQSTYDTFAAVTIGDSTIAALHPGERRIVTLGGKSYGVTLTRIAKGGCTFAFLELAAESPASNPSLQPTGKAGG